MDRLYSRGIKEPILAKITISIIKGLAFLKQELAVIHRDVKPTNVLVNMRGEIKLCDFGVSGQLVQSLAKTNIGCQSYMAVSCLFRPTNVNSPREFRCRIEECILSPPTYGPLALPLLKYPPAVYLHSCSKKSSLSLPTRPV